MTEKIEDVGCGIVSFNNEAMQKLSFPPNVGGGYTIDAWIKMQAIARGWNIDQFPVKVTYNKGASPIKRGLRMTIGITLFIIKEGLRFRFWNRRNYIFWLDKYVI